MKDGEERTETVAETVAVAVAVAFFLLIRFFGKIRWLTKGKALVKDDRHLDFLGFLLYALYMML